MSARSLLAVYPFLPFPPNFGGKIRCFHLLDLLRDYFRVELVALTNSQDESAALQELANRVDQVFTIRSPLILHPSRRQKVRNMLSAVPWEIPLRSKQLERFVAEKSASSDILFLYSARLSHLRHLSRSQANVLDLDDVPHIILSRKIKRMTAVKPRLGYALELLKTLCYEIKMLTRFDVTLVTSELDLYRLRRWNPTLQLRVVPNGVDTELFRFNEIGSRREQVIIFVGALDYEPNELAVKWLCTSIFPRIRRVIPRSRLLLVGHNPSRSVQSLAGPGIEIVGKVPDVRPYLRECSVSVVPITLGGGTRIKILEAAAAGRPVVSTSVGAEGLNLIPGREIEIADTEDDFVSKTVHLLSNPGKAAGMAKLARSRVERDYTWELSKRRLAEAISPWL